MKKWTYQIASRALADTGDTQTVITITDGNDVLFSYSEDIEEADLDVFCSLLDLMPDLFSQKIDELSFEIKMLEQEGSRLASLVAAQAKALEALSAARGPKPASDSSGLSEWPMPFCDHPCGPSDFYPGGMCDKKGCYQRDENVVSGGLMAAIEFEKTTKKNVIVISQPSSSRDSSVAIHDILHDDEKMRKMVGGRSALFCAYSIKDNQGKYRSVIDIESVVVLLRELFSKTN